MAKLIPGRIRNEGIELYQSGKFELIEEKDSVIKAMVDGKMISFSLDTEEVNCQCDFFKSKQYCLHQAALEYFMKNDPEGQKLVSGIKEEKKEKQATQAITSFGSRFLDHLSLNDDDTLRYQLLAVGEQSLYTNDIWWTLRIRRLPDERSYIIRDIRAFLLVIEEESFYQIGKNYYEPLSLLNFDASSQELITFLWRVIPRGDRLDSEHILPNHSRHLALPLGYFEEGLELLQALPESQLTYADKIYKQVTIHDLVGEEGLIQFKIDVHRQYIELMIKEKDYSSLFDHRYLFYKGIFYHLNQKQRKLVANLKTLPIDEDGAKYLRFNLEEQAKLAASLLDFQEVGQVEAPKTFQIRDFTPKFYFDSLKTGEISLSLRYDYGQLEVVTEDSLLSLPFASNFKKEEKIKRLMAQAGFEGYFSAYRAPLLPSDLYTFFEETLNRFRKIGQVYIGDTLAGFHLEEKPRVSIATKGSLLDVSFDFSNIVEDDVDEALTALYQNAPYFISQSGKLILFDEETQKVAQVLQKLRAKTAVNGHLELSGVATYQIADHFKNISNISFSDDFKKMAQDLTHPENYPLPSLRVQAELRDYQLSGVRWLSMLDHYGFGGILADDMGLGKTLQTISFLSSKLTKASKVLILSPSSLIYNWQDEFKKFLPDLDVVVAYGSKVNRDELIQQAHQVTITSYTSFRQDFEVYRQYQFDYLILDEAQVMKNTQTKIAQHLREFEAKQCFALSGTPVENKLLEIWSIFQIVLPGLLPNKKTFLKLDPKTVSRYIKPFVMRRKKEDVLPELPDLIETTYTNELADSQKAIYLAQLRQMQERIKGASDSDLNRSKIEILSGITRLRQICDTPKLFMTYEGESGKINSLRELLQQIKDSGHRALVFSQFRGMLDIAEEELTKIGLTSYKITGSTPADQRQEITRAFNNGSKDLVLISLKAGGVGLNLTGADTVVLIDLWWNPAVEMQAISRAHRLGQRENVEVYRLITRGTIEEKILELQESKKHLVASVLDGDATQSNMTIEEIKEILGMT